MFSKDVFVVFSVCVFVLVCFRGVFSKDVLSSKGFIVFFLILLDHLGFSREFLKVF